jgi:hypothetical protein
VGFLWGFLRLPKVHVAGHSETGAPASEGQPASEQARPAPAALVLSGRRCHVSVMMRSWVRQARAQRALAP